MMIITGMDSRRSGGFRTALEAFIRSERSALMLVLIYGFLFFTSWDFSLAPLGVAFCAFGGTIYIHGFLVMGRAWSVRVESKGRLVEEGIFRHARHPLYLGALMIAFGLVVLSRSLPLALFFILIVLPYVCARAVIEEAVLSQELPAYRDYVKRTGMFLPLPGFKMKLE